MEVLVQPPPGAGPPIYFYELNGPRSLGGKFYCDDKPVARSILSSAGLSVATSQTFEPSELREGLRYAERIGYPVVVKPTGLARGVGVTANIRTPEAFVKAWRRARTANQGWMHIAATFARSVREAPEQTAQDLPARAAAYRDVIRDASSTAWQRRWHRILVEKHFQGGDFRAFVVGDDIVFVTHRKPANVVGDGLATIGELIERKNAVRAENLYLCDHPIPTTPQSLDRLTSTGLTLSDVPAAGETVILRSVSNLSAGGDSIDFTDDAHPGFIDIAIRAVGSIPGLEYGGVDLITPDITVPPTATNYIVGEIEHSPAMITHFPLLGTPRDMAGAVLQYYLHHGSSGTDRRRSAAPTS
jgi:D-alanine-D-alanine ligase-like ATP-grasp enzyme